MNRQMIRAMAGQMQRLQCCGIVEFHGLGGITSKDKAMAIRRAAYYGGKSGMVIATVTPRVAKAAPFLRAAGFKTVRRFVNPRTDRPVQVMMAPSLKTGGGIRTEDTDANIIF